MLNWPEDELIHVICQQDIIPDYCYFREFAFALSLFPNMADHGTDEYFAYYDTEIKPARETPSHMIPHDYSRGRGRGTPTRVCLSPGSTTPISRGALRTGLCLTETTPGPDRTSPAVTAFLDTMEYKLERLHCREVTWPAHLKSKKFKSEKFTPPSGDPPLSENIASPLVN